MIEWFRKGQDRYLAPVLFLFVCILAYGLQVSHLGYYLDDWVILNSYNLGGAKGVFEYAYYGNRPLVFWLWLIGFKLFQSTPIYWQIWALIWRWLAVVILWKACTLLWPKAMRQVTLAALLFAVYPLFRQQASALTYSFHWICFFLWGLSIYMMIKAVQQPRRFSWWIAGSLLTGGIQLFSQEFFVGLELLRPFVLWLALRPYEPEWRGRLKRLVLTWAPFLVILVGYLIWRTRLMPIPNGADRNDPEILYGLFRSPLSTIPKLLVMFLQDSVQTLLGVWYEAAKPDLFVFTPVSNLVAWGEAALAFVVLLVFFLVRRAGAGKSNATGEEPWYITAAPFGFIAMILGFLPGWMIGRHIYDLTGIYNDRFGLPAMFGAALLVVAVVDLLIKTDVYKIILVCLLIGLGTGQNFRYETNYRWSWEKQLQLYWQLKWRAPDIKKPTAVYGDGSIVSYLGGRVTTSAIDQAYGPGRDAHFVDYWYLDVSKENVKASVEKPSPVVINKGAMYFNAPAGSSLVLSFDPDNLQCLWVLGKQDQTNPYLPAQLAVAVPLSNLDQILPTPSAPLRADIFGQEPAHDWCYYYEKADLARQTKDWSGVVGLWKEAEQKGKHPHTGVEYGAYIEGFAHTGDWETAIDLTRKAEFPKYVMRAYVCDTWKRVAADTPDSPGKQKSIAAVIDEFECRDELH